MNWNETISKASAFLEQQSVPDSQVAAELLAARLLKVGRGFLAGELEKEPNERQLEAMRRAMKRLVAGEPLQYVLGEWDFRRLTLKCDRRALIPRPETEELVTRVLTHLKSAHLAKPFVVDVGTGTGAIILSIAQEYQGEGVFLGTDLSEDAIALARENAQRLGLEKRVSFAVADGLDDFDEPECIDVIVSNPPYIPSAVCDRLDPRVKNFEPRMALDGGKSGLDFYERYLADAFNLLRSGGRMFLEIDSLGGKAVHDMMEEFGFSDIRIEKDFSGNDRYAIGTMQ